MSFPFEPLGNYVSVIGGFAFKSENFAENGIPIIRISDIQDGSVLVDKVARIPETSVGNGGRYTVEPGDILIAMSGATTGKIGLVPQCTEGPILQNQRVGNFKINNPGKLHKPYLKHYLCSLHYQSEISNTMAGAAQPNISSKQLENIPIPLPPLPEQRRIAAILDQADALRAKRREALAQLDSLTQSIFVEMFGDPAINCHDIESVYLSEVTTRIKDGTHLTPKFRSEGVPFIFVKNFNEGQIDFQTDKFISEEEHAALYKRSPIEEGDVLYTIVGATYGQAVAIGNFTRFAFQRHVAHLKPDTKKILPEFLRIVMQLPFVKRQADRGARGAAQPTINLTELRQFEIPLPTLTMQRELVNRVDIVDKLKALQRCSLSEFDTLFASLQHRAFRGEL